MRKIICVLFVFQVILFLAQNGNANVNGGNTTREALLGRSGYTSPLETEGSPYLYSEYKKAKIANNTTLVDMRYNAYKDEVDIINNAKNMTIYKKPEYSPVRIIDSDEILYLLEYPYNGKKITGYLFEVRKFEGFKILMKISKSYDKGKYAQDSFERDKKNVYEYLPDVFYIQKDNGEIVEMPKTKSQLIEMFPDRKMKIEQTIKDKKLDTKKLNMLSQIFAALS